MSTLASQFPAHDALPAHWLRPPDEAGLTLLLEGQLQRWGGPSQRILSAVCARAADGSLAQVDLGPAAAASKVEGLVAVEDAVKAWATATCPPMM